MSDSENEVPEVFQASKLGEYTVLRDIAEGTFGKVKSEFSSPNHVDHPVTHRLPLSGAAHCDWSYCRDEIYFQGCYS
jgi:hypothetical protein